MTRGRAAWVPDPLAAAHVERMTWRRASRWHPLLVVRLRVVGVSNLRRLRDEDKGVLSFMPQGTVRACSRSLARAGIPLHDCHLANVREAPAAAGHPLGTLSHMSDALVGDRGAAHGGSKCREASA
jgi:hypothetical protein